MQKARRRKSPYPRQSRGLVYKDGGWEAISLQTMGRPRGSNKTLSPLQEDEVIRFLLTPEIGGMLKAKQKGSPKL